MTTTDEVISRSIDIELVSGHQEFRQLESLWRSMVSNSRRATLFSDWEWTSTWWDVFGDAGFRLNVLVCRRGKEVIGLAPFVIGSQVMHRRFGALQVRALRFLGTGEQERDEVSTEYPDILSRPVDEVHVADAVADWLARQQRTDWDIACLDNCLEDSIARLYFAPALAARRLKVSMRAVGFRYWIALPVAWDQYLDGLGKSFREKILVSRRRLSRAGVVELEILREPVLADAMLDRLAALHASRWESKGSAGVFASASFRHFHELLLRRSLGNVDFAFWFLKLDGRDIAALYTFERDGTVFFYQSGLDADRAGNLSPGVIVMSMAIEDAVRNGRQVFDFMKGTVQSYKSNYGCETMQMFRVTVCNRTLRGIIAWLLQMLPRPGTWIENRVSSKPAAAHQATSVLNRLMAGNLETCSPATLPPSEQTQLARPSE